jgi:hypothetical protein
MYCVTLPESGALQNIESKQSWIPPGTNTSEKSNYS